MERRYSSTGCHYVVSGSSAEGLYMPSFDSFDTIQTKVQTERPVDKDKILKSVRSRNRSSAAQDTTHRRNESAFIQKYGTTINRRRKRAAACHLKTRMVQLLLAAVLLTMLFGGIAVHADPGFGSKENHMIYREIIVEQGDTLWDIASDWHASTGDSIRTYIRKLQKMNHLHGDLIQEGKPLLIYYGSQMEKDQ